MHPYADLLEFLRTVTSNQAAMQRPYFVSIDGYAGAGKSSLTKCLSRDLLKVQSVMLDDFYCPLSAIEQAQLKQHQAVQAYFDTQAFCQQILRPLCQQQPATWHPINWLTQCQLPAKQLRPLGIIIIEGVFASHDDLMAYMDTGIMVVASATIRTHRVLKRPQQNTQWLTHWQATENWFHAQQKTAENVSWVIDGEKRF